jgi:stress-induced morphogen
MTLEDTSDGCGSKFKLILVSSVFEGKGLLDRQRSVNKYLEEEMKIIHALQMKQDVGFYTSGCKDRQLH